MDERTADIVIEALRVGEVPAEGQDAIATGIEAHIAALAKELPRIAAGRGRARFVRGDFGAGKTFFLRYLAALARKEGFAASYVRVSYPEVPLHKPVAVYRALCSGLGVSERPDGALRHVAEQWLYKATERVMDPSLGHGLQPGEPGFDEALSKEVKTMLGGVADAAPAFAQALGAYAAASLAGEEEVARALLQWVGGDPKVAATAKRRAHLVGNLDATDVLPMLRGLAALVTQAGYRGLVVVVDEVERLVRLPRADSRKTGLELLQNWMGAMEAGQVPGVLLVVAGTSSFFTSSRAVPMLEPLQQRIGTLDDGPFPDLDAAQIALPPFNAARLQSVGVAVRDLYEVRYPGTTDRCDDAFVSRLAGEVAGAFRGKVETTPRRFLRELIGVLGRCQQHVAYRPHEHFRFQVNATDPELADAERAAIEGRNVAEAEVAPLPEGFDL
ncbi:ATP-binding protein [Deltaproteobacteria bacterium]|nr:ATP-binding protein [Deltaproteobacteria bacterium]